MNRPTKEQVDDALEWAEGFTRRQSEGVLAAEVRALREVLGEVEQASQLRIAEFRALDAKVGSMGAVLTRVEKLPAKWRGYLDDTYSQYNVCADELETALRGEP